MAYNLDVFENLVFRVPPARRLRVVLAVLGTGYGLLAFTVAYFTVPGVTDLTAGAGFVTVFLVPAFVTAGLTGLFPNFPRRWGYLLGITGATFSVLFVTVEFLVGISREWRVITFGSAALLLTLLAVLVLTASTDRPLSMLLVSAPVPATLLWLPVIGSRWYGLPGLHTTRALVAIGVVTIGLMSSVFVHERLFDANVTYIDGSQLTSTLLTGRERDIDAGYPHEPRVQTLVVDTGDDSAGKSFRLVTPWVHPGPLVNFGGGAVAERVIRGVNEGGNESGFFAKIPCTHREDAAEVAISDRILDAVVDPVTTGRASKLLCREYDTVTFHGRRYGDQRVVLVEPENFGDFPPSIFAERIDPADTLVIDRHAYEADGERGIRYGSVGADRLRSELTSFIAELDNQPLGEYRAGTAVDTDGKQLCALVEEVDGQRTVVFGSNENEVSDTMRDVGSNLDDEFDHAVVFSTDTHHDMHDLAARSQVDPSRIRSVVAAADEAVGPASAGIGHDFADETRLLGTEYHALMYTINYVLRSFTVSLVVLYALTALVLFV